MSNLFLVVAGDSVLDGLGGVADGILGLAEDALALRAAGRI